MLVHFLNPLQGCRATYDEEKEHEWIRSGNASVHMEEYKSFLNCVEDSATGMAKAK